MVASRDQLEHELVASCRKRKHTLAASRERQIFGRQTMKLIVTVTVRNLTKSGTARRTRRYLVQGKKKFFLDKNKRCFRCLCKGHDARNCMNKKIRCEKCERFHHTTIHGWRGGEDRAFLQSSGEPDDSEIEWTEGSDDEEKDHAYLGKTNQDTVSLRVIPVRLRGLNGHTEVFNALLDEGAQGSYLSEEARLSLGLKGRSFQRKITGVGGQTKPRPESPAVRRPRLCPGARARPRSSRGCTCN